jgi:hypothetical protein
MAGLFGQTSDLLSSTGRMPPAIPCRCPPVLPLLKLHAEEIADRFLDTYCRINPAPRVKILDWPPTAQRPSWQKTFPAISIAYEKSRTSPLELPSHSGLRSLYGTCSGIASGSARSWKLAVIRLAKVSATIGSPSNSRRSLDPAEVLPRGVRYRYRGRIVWPRLECYLPRA